MADLQSAVLQRIQRGEAGGTTARTLARGDGWSVADYVCTRGPEDRSFEEQHSVVQIGVVLAGTFQYASLGKNVTLTPGSLLLGNAGQSFECDHAHAPGDRCVAFRFAAEYFDRLGADAGLPAGARRFQTIRVPSLPVLGRVSARAAAGVMGAALSWEELGLQLGAQVIQLANGAPVGGSARAPRGAMQRVTVAVRAIERDPAAPVTLHQLAAEARLSPFHFLRTFREVTGVTPHQFVRRLRLREAAARLAAGAPRIADVALDAGFGDLSNFNHAFRAEYGVSPRRFQLGG